MESSQSVPTSRSWQPPDISRFLPAFVFVYSFLAFLVMFAPLLGNYEQTYYDHYYYQAVSWLNGRTDLDNAPEYLQDVVILNGHKYLPLGPLPTVFTLPLVLIFGDLYRQSFISYPLTLIAAYVAWRILIKLGVVSLSSRLWLVALFFLGTVYFTAMAHFVGAWFVGHIVTCLFVFLGIDEALGKKRPILMGIYIGLAAGGRFTALFGFPFYLWMLAAQNSNQLEKPAESTSFWPQFAKLPTIFLRYVLFGIGAAIPLGAIFYYNFVRFGSFLETGYNTAKLGGFGILDEARAYGLFSLAHIPKNIYYFLLATPDPYGVSSTGRLGDSPILTFPFLQPSEWGMSILITTPAVIYVVKASLRLPMVQAAWLGIVTTAIPIFTYYGVGWTQFGYRYALDFTPFLWLLIALVLRNRKFGLSKPSLPLYLIMIGCAVNLWGAYWFWLPFFHSYHTK